MGRLASYAKAIAGVNSSVINAFRNITDEAPAEVHVSVPSKDTASAGYCCGFGKRALLPEDEVTNYCIAGYNIGKHLTGINDLCYARAVWLDDKRGLGGVLLIALDVIGVSSADIAEIRNRLAAFSEEAHCRSINVMSTHNHETIDTLGPWGDLTKMESGRVEGFMSCVFDAAAAAAKEAYYNRCDGQLYYGTVDVLPEVIRDGKFVLMQDDSRYPFETDTTMARFRFAPDEEGRNEIYIVNYAAHAEALIGENRRMSADYPGAMCEAIKRITGADTVFINGAIGGLVMPGYFHNADSDAKNVSTAELRGMADTLGGSYFPDENEDNCGYPVLRQSACDGDNAVMIEDERQLESFARAVSAGNSMAGTTVRLCRDISLCGESRTGIGTLEKRFRGFFDGNGHVISGLNISGGSYTGFFAALGDGARVSGLTVRGTVKGGEYTGGIAGYADGNVAITDCRNETEVTGAGHTGGIVGAFGGGELTRCSNHGRVSGSKTKTGGIAGYAERAHIDSCYNRGDVSCRDIIVGGVCGEAEATVIENCYNAAAVFPLMCRNAGQIAGKLTCGGRVANCYGDSERCLCPAVSLTRVANDGSVSVYDQMEDFGAHLARFACSVKDKKLEAEIGFVKITDKFPIKNVVLTFAALSGLINNSASMVRRAGSKAPALALETGLTYMKIGGVNILMLPGEIFTELVSGAFLDDRHAACPLNVNPMPLSEIFGDDGLRIFGLCNDEIGYIIPPNDFILHESLPYINPARDRNGKIHYEETNSLGPATANKIAQLAALAKKTMDEVR